MANYICSCRSNYFKVKDRAAFDDWAAQYDIEVHDAGGINKGAKDGFVCILGMCPDGGGWPHWKYHEETEEDEEIDFFAEVAEHLDDDSVAVFMEAGAEKLRYIFGQAVAVHPDGQILCVQLSDIYVLAEKEWGVKPTAAEY